MSDAQPQSPWPIIQSRPRKSVFRFGKAIWNSIFAGGQDTGQFVLDAEQLERYRMVATMDDADIIAAYRVFMEASSGSPFLTQAQFLQLPMIASNPLRDRLAFVFGYDSTNADSTAQVEPTAATLTYDAPGECVVHLQGAEPGRLQSPGISFETFLRHAAVLSVTGDREAKLRYAFDMYDFDGDGRIGFMDLTKVLARCCAFADHSHSQDRYTSSNSTDPLRPQFTASEIANIRRFALRALRETLRAPLRTPVQELEVEFSTFRHSLLASESNIYSKMTVRFHPVT